MNARTKTFNFPFRENKNHQAYASTNVRKILDTIVSKLNTAVMCSSNPRATPGNVTLGKPNSVRIVRRVRERQQVGEDCGRRGCHRDACRYARVSGGIDGGSGVLGGDDDESRVVNVAALGNY